MNYPENPGLRHLAERIVQFGELKHEYGAKNIDDIYARAQSVLTELLAEVKNLPEDQRLLAAEPNSLEGIRKLRADGPRRMWKGFKEEEYLEKLEGAFLSRMAGCILGAIVEKWSIEAMENWANKIGAKFPPVDYWSKTKNEDDLRYNKSPRSAFTSEKMDGVPADDDIVYTLLGLLIAEEYGLSFTTHDVGKAWVKYLPIACTAEDVALKNLKRGISALKAGGVDNPFCQWIGADIRSDPWAYMAPGLPEVAAELAYRDAYLSHRRNGIFGEMYFAAAQSAAFAVDNVIDALKIGLSEIPRECMLYKDITWALEEGKNIKNYKDARLAVDERFSGMSPVHTNNNACLTVFGLMIGENDIDKVLRETVAMGLDNDCTAATAGSIVGAVAGKKNVSPHWTRKFNNIIHTYLIGNEVFYIDDVIKRFARLARKCFDR